MPRFDIYKMPAPTARGYVVDVQSALLSDLKTRVVAPLLPYDTTPSQITDLNPDFEIDGERYVLVIQALASVKLRDLKRPVGSLAPRADAVTRALDILLTGF